MTKSMRAVTFLVAATIAAPAMAGQAVPRTSGTATASSGSSGGGGGGSSSSGSSGSSGSSSSGGSSGPVGASGSGMFGGEFRSMPSRIASGNSSRTGTAAARPAPAPGGIASGGGDASASSSAGSRFGSDLSQGFGGDPSAVRNRNGRPITGAAAARPVGIGGGGNPGSFEFVSFPFYGPWGLWYPWGGGYGGWNSYLMYNPWSYAATRWYWGPYGMWYDPYSYWDPFYGSGMYSRTEREPRVEKTTGALRIKANPSHAKVYIDNALVGTVDEFDGLNDGLEVERGRHTLEVRAEGYVSQTQEINVKVGTKQTIRVNLKEKK